MPIEYHIDLRLEYDTDRNTNMLHSHVVLHSSSFPAKLSIHPPYGSPLVPASPISA